MRGGGAPTGDTPHPAEGGRTGLRAFVASRLDPKASLGLHLTVGLAVAALAIWLFGALLDAVLDNAVMVRWDIAAAASIHERTTPSGLRVFDVITQLGSPVVMTTLGALGGALLLWRRRRILFIAWLATFAGGAILDYVLKMAVHRTRPSYGAAYLHGESFSFPSGHAFGSIIGYGMLIYVTNRVWHPRRPLRAAVAWSAIAVIVLVGVSRIYLGVHYPSDVLGGWAGGAAWLAVCMTLYGIARRRHAARTLPVDSGVAADARGDALERTSRASR